MDYFTKSIDETAKSLNTDCEKGLSSNEAQARLNQYGENRLVGEKERTKLQMFFDQFKDFLVIILIVASIISIIVGIMEGEGIIDGIIIMAIVILNAILGVVQENRANNALKALKEMSSPQAKVIRNGSIEKIASTDLVPGDVVILEAGDYIPADLRLIQSANLKIDESSLTGESVASEKFADEIVDQNSGIGDQINCAFMGSIITYGRGKGIVTNTGMKTQMGNIATMLNTGSETGTPLQKKLDSFGKMLGIACIIICIIIFGLGVIRGQDLLEVFMTAVSLAVAAIPEGLTVVVTVVLALGMQKMVKVNAIVKRLSAVETLGSTTVICSDKTGTLTQNKMTVVKIFDGNEIWEVTGTGYIPEGKFINEVTKQESINSNLQLLLTGAVLCCDAEIQDNGNKIIGDPTEVALIVVGAKAGFTSEKMNSTFPRIDEIPFDSDRKLMSTVHKENDKIIMYTKGAPDIVLSRSKYIFEAGKVVPITDQHKSKIMENNNKMAQSALRVLAVSYKELTNYNHDNLLDEEQDLIFIGLTGMIDPPREEAKKSVEVCKRAGIRAIMITGDHKTTASAIGKQLGIIESENQSMEGKEINNLSDEQLKETVKNVSVFARVSPEHKVRLVDAVKANGNIVAMTGDGVNDAPALKKADIGIAMGITGTDVAKEAADMILTDDNFSTIVRSVEEGRTIYSNIRKFVGYLLSCNIGEILIVFTAMLLNWGTPLLPIQLLMINLVTDAFPAFALGMEQKEKGVMDRKPRDPKEPIVDKKMGIAITIQSIALAAATLFSFQFGLHEYGDIAVARTFCFVTLVTGELLRAYSARSEDTFIFKMKLFSNSFLNKSVLVSLIILLLIVYVPFLQVVFGTIPLSILELDVALLLALVPVVGGEIAKIFK